MVERRYAHVGFCRQLLDAQVFGVFILNPFSARG